MRALMSLLNIKQELESGGELNGLLYWRKLFIMYGPKLKLP